MAKATDKQLSDLEKAHKEQLYLLAKANDFYIKVGKQVILLPETDRNKIIWRNYKKIITPLVLAWILRQRKFEKEGLPVLPIYAKHFFDTYEQADLNRRVAKIDRQGKGIGFIPLLIWAGIAIAGFITAAFVTDELVNTADEKTKLMDQTARTATELGLTKEEAAKLIGDVTAEDKGGLFDDFKWPLLFGVGLFAANQMGLFKNKS